MVAVGLLCGAVPARHAASIDLRSALAAGSQNVASEPRTMRVTVGVEVALGVILLVGAGLLIGSLLVALTALGNDPLRFAALAYCC